MSRETTQHYSVPPNERVSFKVRFVDEHLVIVEKPARVPTQPGKGHAGDTVLNGLFARYGQELQNLGAARDFGLLHRLDRETSGLLVVARRAGAYDALRAAFEGRAIRKFYWAICSRAPRPPAGVIRLPIGETRGGERTRKTAFISKRGREAETAYRTLDSSDLGALVEARPLTGRLHQIRVHFAAIGCPILGDREHAPGSVAGASPRVSLHAYRLAFTHPVTGDSVDVQSPFPADLRPVLKKLGLKRPDLSHPGSPSDPPPPSPRS